MKNSLLALCISFLLSHAFCKWLIPVLRKWKAGQNILSYVKEHKKKSGTPTMGGLAFVAATLFASALFLRKTDVGATFALLVASAYMIVGILDDVLKRKHRQNLGLKAWQKCAFQTLVALLAAAFCYHNGWTKWYIPFTQTRVELGGWAVPLVLFTFLATVNAVNLTDGLDGLAAGVSVPFFAFLGIIVRLEGINEGYTVLNFALCGALLAYLLFNSSPASVFMGDTGSLALGGFAASIACFSGNGLYIVILGLPFVFSVISVVIQVIYYKATGGKRVFLMSPVHHHFQQKGYSETKISYAYAVVTILLGVLCTLSLI